MVKFAVLESDRATKEHMMAMLHLFISSHPQYDFECKCYHSDSALLGGIEDRGGCDLYLLPLYEEKHMAIARDVRGEDPNGKIIFFAKDKSLAYDAFAVYAFQYLLEPIRAASLFAMLERALCNIESLTKSRVLVNAKDGMIALALADIAWAESEGHAVLFHMSNGDIVRSKTTSASFDKVAGELCVSGRFLRTHVSYVVNLAKVQGVIPDGLQLESGQKIPVSRQRATEVRTRCCAFWEDTQITVPNHLA